MKKLLCLCFILVSAISALPYHNGYRTLPQRSVMFGGYYGHPLTRRNYGPQGSMTAVISDDTIATNSFAGEPFLSHPQTQSDWQQQEVVEEYTEKNKAHHEEIPLSFEEETFSEVSTTVKPKRIPKKKSQKPQKPQDEVGEEEADADDSESGWPFGSRKGGVPSYNAFFPVMIGGSGGKAGENGFNPGSATAIANSFSTGKGGVASSHATSFGDPYLSSLYRNGMFNFGRSKPQVPKNSQNLN